MWGNMRQHIENNIFYVRKCYSALFLLRQNGQTWQAVTMAGMLVNHVRVNVCHFAFDIIDAGER